MRGKSIFLIFIFLAIASLILALAFLDRGKDVKWDAKAQQIEKAAVEAKARTVPHSKLQGDLTPGNAWEEYELAIKDVSTWKGDDTGLRRFLNGDKSITWVEKFAVEHAEALQHLQTGARRTDGQYPYDWNKGREMQYPSAAAVQMLASFAAAQARLLADKGQAQEAASLLVDLTVFARDVATNSPLRSRFSGQEMYATAFAEMRHLLLSGKLSQAQLLDLQKKLEIVERDFPPVSNGIATDMLLIDMAVREIAEGALFSSEWRFFVRHGNLRLALKPRETSLKASETNERLLRRFEKLDNLDFKAAQAELLALERDVNLTNEKMVTMAVPPMRRVFIGHHNVLTRLLLLQAAAGFLATNHMPTLRDPFGDKLLSEQKDGKTRIWSRGSDGMNSNGRGDWMNGKPDLVLEIVPIR